MDIIDSDIDRLRRGINQCEAELRKLKVQLCDAELQRRETVRNAATWPKSATTSSVQHPLQDAEYRRYGRQLILPEIGLKGQLRLRSASVLVVGAGGLGCPAAAYLASAGLGMLGLVDGDTVEESNLHRQILHSTRKLLRPKVDSAIDFLTDLNPNVKYAAYRDHLTAEAALDIFQPYDLILDCTDNPASRYLISDASVLLGKPLVSASALRTDGQLMIFNYPPAPPGDQSGGPCYRCMFPRPPPPESVVTCGEGGILGPVVGAMGVLQALEAIKIITRDKSTAELTSNGVATDTPQALLFSAYSATPFRSFRMCRRRKTCATCSAQATVTRESLSMGSLDYLQFCGANDPTDSLPSGDRMTAAQFAETRNATRVDGGGDSVAILIDTREQPQFDICSIEGSVSIPLSSIVRAHRGRGEGAHAEDVEWLSHLTASGPNVPIVAVCRLGNDSQLAVKMLRDLLYAGRDGQRKKIVDIKGGLKAWRQEVDPEFPEY